MPVNLLSLNQPQLAEFFVSIGEKPFRAKQLLRWMHHFGERDFARMTDLGKALREKLARHAVVDPPRLREEQVSADGTRKWLLDVGAGNAVEAVFIPEDDRGTLCISSQVGCALECTFCSTGRQGFNRNLTVGEIIGQLWWANQGWANRSLGGDADDLSVKTASAKSAEDKRLAKSPEDRPSGKSPEDKRLISNVVMMGMGEPLTNFDNVVAAMDIMLDDSAYGLSRRRVTLSTSGVLPGIERLRERCPVALAVSLHAPNDALRDVLVPINRKYPLAELLAACRRYVENAPRDFVTFEYVMLDSVNDSLTHARQLAELCRDVPCKFNLIPFNAFPDSGYRRSKSEAIQRFRDVLMQAGYVVTVRKTRGGDIDAACGQLAGQVVDKTRRTQIRLVERAAGESNVEQPNAGRRDAAQDGQEARH